ncbi:hypothetical protein JVU11DRAFT_8810 [Chiua virens]|nr:hypothetical protein JVU11DRAFT_8810 [Chiua virens]
MLAFTSPVSPRRSPMPRFRFTRTAKRMDMADANVVLHVIIRPSLQLWRIAPVLGRASVLTCFKRPKKPTISDDSSSSTSSITLKKKVRFDEQPVTISRKGFFGRCRRDSNPPPPSPVRPCLVIRKDDQPGFQNRAQPLPETDCVSVYEDCLSEHASIVNDIHALECDDDWDAQSLRRRSDFYKMESGIATFDRGSYASHCVSRWLDEQREEARDPRKPVFEHPILLSWPSRTLSPLLPSPPIHAHHIPRPLPPVAVPTSCPVPRSLPRRIWSCIEDELQNALVLLIVGYTCIITTICLGQKFAETLKFAACFAFKPSRGQDSYGSRAIPYQTRLSGSLSENPFLRAPWIMSTPPSPQKYSLAGADEAEASHEVVLENTSVHGDEAVHMGALPSSHNDSCSRAKHPTRTSTQKNPKRSASEAPPELDSDGEEIQEPEVDLSAFLEKQRMSAAAEDEKEDGKDDGDDGDEIDHSLAHITSRRQPSLQSKKGRVQTIEWDTSLEEMTREKAAAEANRDLKERFRAKASTLRAKPMALKERKKENDVVEAPPLPTQAEHAAKKNANDEMQDFLDDLLG